MNPLTVLFNTYPIAFDCPGGGEVQLLQYEKYLVEAGVRVLRYDPWNPQPQFEEADIVHYFSVMGASWLFCRHVVETRKKPLVISPIVWIDNPEKYNLQEIGWLLGMAAHILPNSQAECTQLADLFDLPPSLFSPVVNGVEDIFFTPALPEIFRDYSGIREPFVLCMGNLEERKNQLRLIRALKDTGICLVLAGQDREAEYAATCREEADGTVHFVGMLEHGSELHRSAYAAALVLALPSTLETPGLAALEAGASGCRLVLTKEGCTEEYFKGFAQYLDPYDTKNIADTVLSSIALPRPSGLACHVQENFTWRRAAKQLLRAYRGVVHDRD